MIEKPETVVASSIRDGRRSEPEIVLERNFDAEQTARLLDRSFPQGYQRDAVYLDWLYNRSCSRRAVIVAAFQQGGKVGQMVFIPHEIDVDGERRLMGLTVDFFVVPEHRRSAMVIQLTRQALDICHEQGLDGIMGVPNIKSLPVVNRFMKTRPTRKLGLRAGLAWPIRRRSITTSVAVNTLDNQALHALLEPYVRNVANARIWCAASLRQRLRSPVTSFNLHACEDALAISCRFPIKGVMFTMLCGFLNRTADPVGKDVVTALVEAACALNGRPNYCYIGVNNGLEQLPGFEISERIHSSPLTVVARTLAGHIPIFVPDRYEMIDFDMV